MPSLQQREILVIDDERRMADSLQRLLGNWGYIVHIAYSGIEGIDKVKQFTPPLVITDLRMAEVDGYEVKQPDPNMMDSEHNLGITLIPSNRNIIVSPSTYINKIPRKY